MMKLEGAAIVGGTMSRGTEGVKIGDGWNDRVEECEEESLEFFLPTT